jgi:hypothetical protein
MRKSVGPDDSFLNKVTLVGYKERGDARAAWGAIAFCINKGLDFPPWVMCYLAQTAERIEGHLARIMHRGTLMRPEWADFRDGESSQSA